MERIKHKGAANPSILLFNSVHFTGFHAAMKAHGIALPSRRDPSRARLSTGTNLYIQTWVFVSKMLDAGRKDWERIRVVGARP